MHPYARLSRWRLPTCPPATEGPANYITLNNNNIIGSTCIQSCVGKRFSPSYIKLKSDTYSATHTLKNYPQVVSILSANVPNCCLSSNSSDTTILPLLGKDNSGVNMNPLF